MNVDPFVIGALPCLHERLEHLDSTGWQAVGTKKADGLKGLRVESVLAFQNHWSIARCQRLHLFFWRQGEHHGLLVSGNHHRDGSHADSSQALQVAAEGMRPDAAGAHYKRLQLANKPGPQFFCAFAHIRQGNQKRAVARAHFSADRASPIGGSNHSIYTRPMSVPSVRACLCRKGRLAGTPSRVSDFRELPDDRGQSGGRSGVAAAPGSTVAAPSTIAVATLIR